MIQIDTYRCFLIYLALVGMQRESCGIVGMQYGHYATQTVAQK